MSNTTAGGNGQSGQRRRLAARKVTGEPGGRFPVAFVAAAVISVLGVVSLSLMNYLPHLDTLADYRPPVVSQVYGDDGSLVGEFFTERRILVPISRVPKRQIQAFLAAEDLNFYRHKGVDLFSILRAIRNDITSGRKKEGASTITQQVTKSLLLTPEKKFSRKIKEALLSFWIESKFSKDEILYLYLNQIYFGSGAYGIEAAAETYFGKTVEQLDLAQMALLAGLPKAPSSYSPVKHLDKAKERQRYVLDRMVKAGFITQAESDSAWREPVLLHPMKRVNSDQAAYFLEALRLELVASYGEDKLYQGGLKIYSTMNPAAQRAAFDSVRQGLEEVDRRQGWRGVLKRLKQEEVAGYCSRADEALEGDNLQQGGSYQGVVVSIDAGRRECVVQVGGRRATLKVDASPWCGRVQLKNAYAPKAPSRVITLGSLVNVEVIGNAGAPEGVSFELAQSPELQGALYALDPRTGAVKAMVGGYDFKKSQFNRALQAKRNAGSAFKPIIYAAALENGLTPATVIEDAPISFPGAGGNTWAPHNYDGVFRGAVTMREALTDSINVVSVKVLERIGVKSAIDLARRLGLTGDLPQDLTLALGSASVTPAELTAAYASFASGGKRHHPYLISRVVSAQNTVLEDNKPDPGSSVLPASIAYIITDLMTSVVSEGTGRRAAVPGHQVAGKTGTTNDSKDAWFVGYVPQLAAGVWVGYDQSRSIGSGIGATGGHVAAPIWGRFMAKALASSSALPFLPPDDVTYARINPRTGQLARGGGRSVSECFIRGSEPGAASVPRQKQGQGDEQLQPPGAAQAAPPPPPTAMQLAYPDSDER